MPTDEFMTEVNRNDQTTEIDSYSNNAKRSRNTIYEKEENNLHYYLIL